MARLVDIRQKFQAISEVLKPMLASLQVYRLSTSDLDFQRFYDLYLLIGQTQEGKWIGFSTKINYAHRNKSNYERVLVAGRDTGKISLETRAIIDTVENTISSYTFLPLAPYYFDLEIIDPSQSVSCFVWEIADARSKAVEQLLESNNFMQVIPLNCKDDYYSLVYIDPAEEYDTNLPEECDAQQYDRELNLQQTIESLAALEYDTSEYEQELYSRQTIKLLDTFDSELTEQKAYRFGLCSIDLYFIGTTPAGDRICLSGVVVET